MFILSLGGIFNLPVLADKPPTHKGAVTVPEPAAFEVLSTESVKSKPVDPFIQEQLRRAKNSLTGVTGAHAVIPGRAPGIAR